MHTPVIMPKVHITLVGGQISPSVLLIKHIEPQLVVFVASEESKANIDKIIDESRRCNIQYAHKTIILKPSDIDEIAREADRLQQTYQSDDISINLMSGTKHWSVIFGIVFSQCPSAQLMFIDANNRISCYKSTNMALASFDLDSLLRQQGNPLTECNRLDDYTEQDMIVRNGVEKIRSANYNDFRELLTTISRKNSNKLRNEKSGRFELDSSSFVEWQKATDDNPNETVIISLATKSGCTTKVFVSPHAINIAFNAGWFELKVAQLISRMPFAKDVLLNCNFGSNEIDIIVAANTKALFVECKVSLYESKDIDKFHSVVQRCGGSQSKALIMSYEKLNKAAQDKCYEYGILFVDDLNKKLLLNTKSVINDISYDIEKHLSKINK